MSAREAEGGLLHLSTGLTGDPKLRHSGLPGLGGGVQEDLWKGVVPSVVFMGETAAGARWGSGPSPPGVRKQL